MPPTSKRLEPKYRCTACSGNIRTAFQAALHPLLKVLVCRRCHSDYGTGDFSLFDDSEIGPGVDEFGDDNYCRWCVDGGNLYACGNDDAGNGERCHYAFCSDCITRNHPEDEVLTDKGASEGFKWYCFACDKTKLETLRKKAQETMLALSQTDLQRPNNNAVINQAQILMKTKGQRSPEETDEDKPKNSEPNRDKSKASDKGSKDAEPQSTKERESVINKDKNAQVTKEKSKQQSNSSKEPIPSKEKEPIPSKEKDPIPSKEKDPIPSKEKDQSTNSKDKETPKNKETDKAPAKEKRSSVSSTVEEPASHVSKKRKTDDNPPIEIVKEPEAAKLPPQGVAPPKQCESALRRLSDKKTVKEIAKTILVKAAQLDQSSKTQNSATKTHPTPGTKQTSTSNTKPPAAPASNTKPSAAPASSTNKQPTSDTIGTTSTNNKPANAPKANIERIQNSLPKSVNPSNKPLSNTNIESSKNFSNASRTVSKQLKSSNEPVVGTCKVPLRPQDLEARLTHYKEVVEVCAEEMKVKFNNVIEMFLHKELGQDVCLLKCEIEDLSRPNEEFHRIILDLMSLYHSQMVK